MNRLSSLYLDISKFFLKAADEFQVWMSAAFKTDRYLKENNPFFCIALFFQNASGCQSSERDHSNQPKAMIKYPSPESSKIHYLVHPTMKPDRIHFTRLGLFNKDRNYTPDEVEAAYNKELKDIRSWMETNPAKAKTKFHNLNISKSLVLRYVSDTRYV